MIKQLPLLLLIILSAFAACKDKNAAPAVKFTNDLKQGVSVTVYYSQADYYRETNPVGRISIAAGATGEMKGELFENGRNYYYDVLSNDNTMSNWGRKENMTPNNMPTLPTSGFKFEYPATGVIKCDGKMTRLVCLGEGKISAKWKAVDATYGDGSIWQNISENKKNLVLTINKDYSSLLSKTDSLGNVTETELTFHEGVLYNKENMSQYRITLQTEQYFPLLNPGKFYLVRTNHSVGEEFSYVMQLQ